MHSPHELYDQTSESGVISGAVEMKGDAHVFSTVDVDLDFFFFCNLTQVWQNSCLVVSRCVDSVSVWQPVHGLLIPFTCETPVLCTAGKDNGWMNGNFTGFN